MQPALPQEWAALFLFSDMMTISSVQNPKVKQLLLLQQKSSERRRTGLFVVEGQREIEHCLEAGYEVDSVYYCPQLFTENDGSNQFFSLHSSLFTSFEVTVPVYEKMAYRGSTEGLMAVVRSRTMSLSDLPQKENPLYVVLERVEKPGNLGAVLRSADAAQADAVIVCDPLTDLFNPNLIRSSIGAIFTVPCVACSTDECIAFLKDHGVRILTAQLQDSHLYYDTDMRCGTAIVMGTESTGLTDTWRRAADAHIRIPMLGRLDSLNVSVSAAILLFEAVRQRQSVDSTR
jgi:TrmH family RNA methyltransferase